MSEYLFSVFPSKNFVDLGMYQFGWERCAPSHSYGPIARNHFLFHYVLSGTGKLFAENEKKESISYSVKSGQGFLIFPNQVCTYIADQEIPWEYVWIEFDGIHAKEVISLTGLSWGQPIYKARYRDIAETMKSEMLYIAHHANESPLHLIGHMYLFMDSFIRSATSIILPKQNSLRDFYIKEAITYIEQNYQNEITIEDIARVCGLNRSYFGKIFHDAIGKSPQEFLISYRMIKATELLKYSKLSIAEIGQAVSYQNQLHFSRAFKKIYGISPRQWRAENQHTILPTMHLGQ